MYKYSELMFLYCESPLHAGSGAGLGAVDLPVQRERATGYPLVHGSALKGALRSLMPQEATTDAIFGPSLKDDGTGTLENAGMIVVGDASILAFPVRSLKGVFAWVTSVDILARLHRELKLLDPNFAGFTVPKAPDAGSAYAVKGGDNSTDYSHVCNPVIVSGQSMRVYLEEFDFTVDPTQTANDAAQWLAEHAIPASHDYWKQRMKHGLVILHDDAFRDFVRYSTEVVTRIALIPETKTVRQGALWTEESLPAETLLFAPIRATDQRTDKKVPDLTPSKAVSTIRTKLNTDYHNRFQLGGNETVGQGIVCLNWHSAPEPKKQEGQP